MKRIFFTLIGALMLTGAYAQPAFRIFDTTSIMYEDLDVVNNNVIAGIHHADFSKLDLRTNTGNSFGSVISSVNVGSPFSSFNHMEVSGNYLYLGGLSLLAVNVSNPSVPVMGTEVPVRFVEELAHWSNMLYVVDGDALNYKIFIHSLANPMQPALVDSFIVPRSGTFKIWQNKCYYVQSDTGTGNRIFTYNLSNTAPYFTLVNALILTPDAQFDYPLMDIVADHMFVKTTDSVYHFHIMPNGDLHSLSRRASNMNPRYLVAKDSSILCYGMPHQIRVQLTSNGASATIDTVDAMTFNSFRNVGRLGNNLYYSEFSGTRLAGLAGLGVTGPVLRKDDRFRLYPNPVVDAWHVDSKTDGLLMLYSQEGKQVHSVALKANNKTTIQAMILAPGHYYYTIMAKDGIQSGGKLIRN